MFNFIILFSLPADFCTWRNFLDESFFLQREAFNNQINIKNLEALDEDHSKRSTPQLGFRFVKQLISAQKLEQNFKQISLGLTTVLSVIHYIHW